MFLPVFKVLFFMTWFNPCLNSCTTCFQQDEVKDWIIPPDYDHIEAEARHLVREADTDGVRKP